MYGAYLTGPAFGRTSIRILLATHAWQVSLVFAQGAWVGTHLLGRECGNSLLFSSGK